MSGVPASDWTWINAAADRYECAWKRGPRPRLEDYLGEVDEDRRPALLEELLRVECELCRRAGEEPMGGDYHRRFPGHAPVVDAVFAEAMGSSRSATGEASIAPAAPPRPRDDLPRLSGVLPGLPETIGPVPHVLLRDTRAQPDGPVVLRSSSDGPEDGGRYQLLGEIGHGGMGSVIVGRDPDLGRDLAVKVLLDEHRDAPELVRRFIEEAQISGQLQHPGIVPVYELGRFGDGRPYFTMKLVQGCTLAALLGERGDAAHDLPRFLGIFEQVCQTVAYAHARSVIHRDLKPSNIMVGSFGEVLVMDWGLAKVLPRAGTAGEPSRHDEGAPADAIRTVRSDSDADASRPGLVMGTLAYMAPEQAKGTIEAIDERADVFGLGSLLCEILTGRPAYTGPSPRVILEKALRGEIADAVRRIDESGADPELRELARRCLSGDPEGRPRHAGEVAAAIAAHASGVRERLREVELERVEAEARADEEAKRRALADDLAREAAARAEEEARGHLLANRLVREAESRAAEERKRRRMTVGLAASVLALAGLAGGTWLVGERSKVQRRTSVALALDEARRRRAEARASEADDPARWADALAAVERAEGLLAHGGDPRQKREADDLRRSLTSDQEADRRETEWSRRLVDIRSTRVDGADGSSAESGYAAVFHEVGIDPDTLGAEEAAARIRLRRAKLARGLVAALDDWAGVRRAERNDPVAAGRLLAVARRADPDAWRDRLRAALDQPGGQARLTALRGLADSARIEELPAVSLDLLGVSLLDEGDAENAAHLLRRAQRSHPRDAWLKYNLARSLQKLGKTEEAIRYLMAARTIHPETAHDLAHLLEDKGETDEAIAIFQDLNRLRPDDALHLFCLGRALQSRGRAKEAAKCLDSVIAMLRAEIARHREDPHRHLLLGRTLHAKDELDEAAAEYRTAIRLKPELAVAHTGLGMILMNARQDYDGAIAEFRTAIRFEADGPEKAEDRYNLGLALNAQGKGDEAIVEHREAIRLRPDSAWAHFSLGNTLRSRKRLDEAAAAYREAIRLKPDISEPHNNLGLALGDQGKRDEAIAEFRAAIRLRPDSAEAHHNLGRELRAVGKLDEAIAAYEEAIRLRPGYADAHNNLGNALADRGKLDEAIATLKEAIRLKPDFALAYLNLGRHLHAQRKADEAIAALREAIRLQPGDADAHNSLGQVLRDQEKLDEAVAAFREAIRLQPDFALAHCNLAFALQNQGKRGEAIAEYREHIRLRPDNAGAHRNLGILLHEQGKLDEAIAEYREAIRIDRDRDKPRTTQKPR